MAGDYFEMVLTMLLGGTTVDYFGEVFTMLLCNLAGGYFEMFFTLLFGSIAGDYFEEVFTVGGYFDTVLTMLLGSMAGGYFEEVVTMFFAMLLGSTARDPAASTAKPVKTDVAVGARVAWHCTACAAAAWDSHSCDRPVASARLSAWCGFRFVVQLVQRLLVTAMVAVGL